MEHLYKSITIKNFILEEFPLPDIALELIIDNLKLAIDLNGYTNKMLYLYIDNHLKKNIETLNNYLYKKYGKNRNRLEKLKKYQLINVIQHFDVDIPLRPFKIDYIKDIKNIKNIDSTIILETVYNMNTLYGIKQISFYKTKDDVLFIKETYVQNTGVYYCTNKTLIKNILLVYDYFQKKETLDNLNTFTSRLNKIYTQDAYFELYYKTIIKCTKIDFNMDISRHLNYLKMPIRDLVDIVDKM